jgi:hypothetical protein
MASPLARGLSELEKSRPAYEKAKDVYDGKIGEVFFGSALDGLIASVGDSFRVNFAAIPVDKLVKRIAFGGAEVVGSEALTAELARALDEAKIEREIRTALKWAAVYGDAYLVAWPGANADELATPDVYYNSPLVMRAVYDEENPRLVLFFVKAFRVGKRTRANLYFPDRIERYISRTDTTKDKEAINYNADEFERYIDADSFENADDDEPESDVANPWGRFPVFHLKHDDNGESHGVPAHLKAYGPQDAITKIVVTQMSDFEGQAFPIRYALERADTDSDLGEDFDDDEDVEVGSRRPKLRFANGTVTTLQNIEKVGEFTPPSAENFLAPAEFYIRAIGVLTDTPAYEFDLKGDQPSGESRKRADAPIQAHAREYTEENTSAIESLLSLVLSMTGSADQAVKVSWQTAEVASDSDSWTVVGSKIANGVPVRVALAEAGYDAETIAEWYPEGAPAYTPAGLSALAESLAKIGNAVTLGTIDRSQVVALLPDLFAAAQVETE